MKIDWKQVPTYEISTKFMSCPTEIKNHFEYRDTKLYLYGISYDKKVIKYGMSGPGKHVMYGERLYRQVAHSKTWPAGRIKGSNGSEWLMIEEEFELRYGKSIGHDLNIKIWDFTNYDFKSINKRKELNSAEAALITAHRDFYKELPVGNLYDEEAANNMPYIPQQVVSRLLPGLID